MQIYNGYEYLKMSHQKSYIFTFFIHGKQLCLRERIKPVLLVDQLPKPNIKCNELNKINNII